MMKNKKLKEVICGVIAAVMILSACGQTNDKKLDSTPEPGAEAPQETEKPEINVPGLTINDTDKIVDQFSQEYDKLLVIVDTENATAYIKNEEINLSDYDYKVLDESSEEGTYALGDFERSFSYFYIVAENGEIALKQVRRVAQAWCLGALSEDIVYIYIEQSPVKNQG